MHSTVSEFELPPEEGAGVGLDLAELWNELQRGATRVAATVYTERRCYVKLARRIVVPPAHSQREARNQALLERFLLGDQQKCLAADTALSPSSVALALQNGLARLGIDCGPAHIPLTVILALHRLKGTPGIPEGRLSFVGGSASGERVVSAPRPDFVGDGTLTRAELEVTRLKLEGKSHEEMAQIRRCSARTIANQLGSVYSKYRVTGRFELLACLIQRACAREAWIAEGLGQAKPRACASKYGAFPAG